MTPPMTLDELNELRIRYRRIGGHGPNRITITTFFSSLSVAAFVGLLGVAPVTDLGSSNASNQRLAILALAISTCLGAAAVLFLLATVSSYKAVQALTAFNPQAVDLLKDDAPADTPTTPCRALSAQGIPSLAPVEAVQSTLNTAHTIYTEGGNAIPYGIGCLVISLLLIGWHAHLWVLAITALLLGLAVVLFGRTYVSHLWHPLS